MTDNPTRLKPGNLREVAVEGVQAFEQDGEEEAYPKERSAEDGRAGPVPVLLHKGKRYLRYGEDESLLLHPRAAQQVHRSHHGDRHRQHEQRPPGQRSRPRLPWDGVAFEALVHESHGASVERGRRRREARAYAQIPLVLVGGVVRRAGRHAEERAAEAACRDDRRHHHHREGDEEFRARQSPPRLETPQGNLWSDDDSEQEEERGGSRGTEPQTGALD